MFALARARVEVAFVAVVRDLGSEVLNIGVSSIYAKADAAEAVAAALMPICASNECISTCF